MNYFDILTPAFFYRQHWVIEKSFGLISPYIFTIITALKSEQVKRFCHKQSQFFLSCFCSFFNIKKHDRNMHMPTDSNETDRLKKKTSVILIDVKMSTKFQFKIRP